MSLFSKKKKREADDNLQLILRLDKRKIKYITERNTQSYDERVLGRSGVLNVKDGELIISCGNEVVLREPIESIKAYELMNLSGVNLKVGGRVFIAYYTDKV